MGSFRDNPHKISESADFQIFFSTASAEFHIDSASVVVSTADEISDKELIYQHFL